jgi:putative oxidoreductase
MELSAIFGLHVSIASLMLRLAIGIVFVIHGYPKLTKGRKGTADWLKSLGLPAGFAALAGVAEFFGGIALLLGILTQIVAALFVLWTIATTWLSAVKMKKKFAGGYEFDIVLLLAALALAVLGGGRISLDYLLRI